MKLFTNYSLLPLPISIVFATFLLLNISTTADEYNQANTINAVIGDKSYIERYGLLPEDEVPDSVRIKVHLNYVEEQLRKRPTNHLTEEQKSNRTKNLDLLRKYRKAGDFPYNDGHPDARRPTFIDKNGHICAVGFLAEQTLGRDVVMTLNQDYKYAYIQQIDHPVFKNWVKSSGFTLEELAMIQPMYGGEPGESITLKRGNDNKIGVGYGTASLVTNTANAIYWSNSAKNPWLFDEGSNYHWYGLAAGTGSILLGSLNLDNRRVADKSTVICGFIPAPCNNIIITQSNHARTAVSAFNIAAGTATTLRAVYHLLTNSDSDGKASKGNSSLPIPIQLGELQTVSNRGVIQPTPVLKFSISL